MHADDGDGSDAVVKDRLKARAQVVEVQRRQDLATGVNAFLDLFNFLVKQFGQDDPAIKQTRTGLIGDPQRVAETLGDDQGRAVAFAFQQRVGRNGRAILTASIRLEGIGSPFFRPRSSRMP